MFEKEIMEFGFTKENMIEIAKLVSNKMHLIEKELFIAHEIYFSKKILSKIISKLFEKEISKYLSNNTDFYVKCAKSDKDSDLTFLKNGEVIKKIEIKVTSTVRQWTGGALSKRPYDHILISWSNNYDDYFIVYTHLEKEEWKKTSDNYYGPIFTVNNLKNKSKTIFMGTISGTKLIRENLNQTKLIFN